MKGSKQWNEIKTRENIDEAKLEKEQQGIQDQTSHDDEGDQSSKNSSLIFKEQLHGFQKIVFDQFMHKVVEKADFDTTYLRSGSIIFNDQIEAYQARNEGTFQQLRDSRMSVLNSIFHKNGAPEEDVSRSEISVLSSLGKRKPPVICADDLLR